MNKSKRRINWRSPILGMGLIAIALVWLGIGALTWHSERSEENEAAARLEGMGVLLEEHVIRSISEIEKVLLNLRQQLAQAKPDVAPQTVLNSVHVKSDIIVQVAVIDSKGIMRASSVSREIPKPIDLSDRPHFKALDGKTDDRLYVSPPLIGRASGRWSVQLARRIVNLDGSFGGVVVASLDPAHLTRFYGAIDTSKSMAVALIGADGIVRARGGAANKDLPELGEVVSAEISSQIAKARDLKSAALSRTDDGLTVARPVRLQRLDLVLALKFSEALNSQQQSTTGLFLMGTLMSIALMLISIRLHHAEARALEQAHLLDLSLANITQGLLLVTKSGKIRFMNQQFGKLLDLPEALQRPGTTFERLMAFQRERGEFEDDLASTLPKGALDGKHADTEISYERQRPNGRVIEVRARRMADGGFVRTVTDVTERRANAEIVERLANEDALTGIANRRSFRRDLDRAIAALADQPDGVQFQVALLSIDLDRFKSVNDTLGHAVGDQLLRAVADRLRSSLRVTDRIARVGGDEFAVIMPRIRSRREPDIVAKRIVDRLSRPYDIDGRSVVIGASVGIAISPIDGRTSDTLLIAADHALYAAKSGGRSQHRFFDQDMIEGALQRQIVEADLRHAIKVENFLLHYQPIISLTTGAIVGAEALIRWQHPTRGLVPPSEFIPIAEDTGLIKPIGAWALETACKAAVGMPSIERISVNLSPVQFTAPNLIETIAGVLGRTGLRPDRLELEITESVLMEDTERALTLLNQIKALGVRIAMDDFGTGYSSLSYLRRFPFDRIKIDRAFVSSLGTEQSALPIIRAVVEMTRALEMSTTAEGIETVEQRDLLQVLGCSDAQGYLFYRPMPLDKLEEVLQAPATRMQSAA